MLTRIQIGRGLHGFTLIEMMVVVAIMAILLMVALPAYEHQAMRGKRAAAQAEMLEIAGIQQQYLLSDRRYADMDTLAAAGFLPEPVVARHYRYHLQLGEGAVPSFELRLVPVGRQRADGWLQLDSQGHYSSEFPGRWWQ
ncbi:prepilin-type N-terminal cleavage/methylation domain-containing protein [Pseudohalioglobus sediminis]|uniref:Prepilin-type N-terminal cleavage/methylation domain-containing protein n=1 Tax=Pseudohalioglobus sediminis TaxID=2606449 RepID=A0A5B0WP33_9GAMM|nr:type IV pilin protein [Pseudohalioglobus sediminis]KAA1188337.1 prepilin-type N-terminal cleavage/methylation domain-containing protein [Pseudohalioglobus sediminis]